MEIAQFKEKSNRKREDIQKKTSRKSRAIKDKIKKVQESEEGLDASFICSFLSAYPNFIGVFAQNELDEIKIEKFPVSLVVNFDMSNKNGSHWIAIQISNNRIEIFDSLGFDKTKYRKYSHIRKFLSKFRNSHKIIFSPQLQPSKSNLCGFYCIFYFIYRSTHSFNSCVSYFKNIKTNDSQLLHYFSNL